jgi:hypothetical protein
LQINKKIIKTIKNNAHESGQKGKIMNIIKFLENLLVNEENEYRSFARRALELISGNLNRVYIFYSNFDVFPLEKISNIPTRKKFKIILLEEWGIGMSIMGEIDGEEDKMFIFSDEEERWVSIPF